MFEIDDIVEGKLWADGYYLILTSGEFVYAPDEENGFMVYRILDLQSLTTHNVGFREGEMTLVSRLT